MANGSSRMTFVLGSSITPKMATNYARKQNPHHFDFQLLGYLILTISLMLPLVAPAEVRRGWKRQYPGRVGSGFSDYKRGAPVHGLGETTAEDFPESFYTGDDIIAKIQHPEKKKNQAAFGAPFTDEERLKRSFTAKSAQYGCVHTWKLPCK